MRGHFEALLRPLFGEDAEFRSVRAPAGELAFRVEWRMPEEGRPNKRSRPIGIRLAQEVLEDYADAPRDEDRADVDRRIVEYVERILSNFEPHHDVPREEPVPPEEWLITSELFQ